MTATAWRRINARRDHRWSRPRYSDFLEGELPSREERRLAEHVELCPECARLIATLEVLLGILPSLRLPPTAALAVAQQTAERVRAQIEEWD
jgi:anti-sigma factor ChrR (cupin superfamily)